ncbi:MAG TPA: GNAT family N-acyltransferase [Blastocatellia bacterium]|nr:GNAT family N-acyltransferase [Blastocatellia bacterium]
MVKQMPDYPAYRAGIPQVEITEGRYRARFARTREELDEVLRLRFAVFNVELREGLDASWQTGRDRDEFDSTCHHLIVLDALENKIIGTYRVQTAEMAAATGFYSAGEFDLSTAPAEVLTSAVELGRACIAREHRNTQVLFLLWKGLAAYLVHSLKQYLFGCCSLTSQDPHEGRRVMELLEAGGHLHSAIRVLPQKGCECYADDFIAEPRPQAKIPQLFRVYLRYGAKVCGPPAIDRLFKTIDYLVLFNVAEMDSQARRAFFGV